MPVKKPIPALRAVPIKDQAGVVLLEGLVAILIFTIGIIGLMGLQAAMVRNTTDARYRIEASNIAQRRLSEIWTTAEANRGNMAEPATDISAESGLPNSTRETIRGAADRGCNSDPTCYIVIVTWRLPGENVANAHNYTLLSYIQ